ncbi:MAG: hypothetical protein M9891_17480 [Austwickia sp.]|nr:hypothetical protein [Actinomycetota bacterium]MCB1254022.1 hypothetical protein [Austwickia sp.]MCO5311042.1 hypothetical protein [Austwickia sp.]
MGGANQAVSGGIGGFLAFFLLACALWLLMRNMNKRLRNIKYDEELEQQRHLAEASQDTLTRPRRPGQRGTGTEPAGPGGDTGGRGAGRRDVGSRGMDPGAGPIDPGTGTLHRASAGY